MAPRRELRQSDYPSTPSSAASAPFQYNSIARPPTGYSANPSINSGFSPPPPMPTTQQPHPGAQIRHRQPHVRHVSTDGLLVEEDDSDGAETALYARSDWTKGDAPSARTIQPGRPTTGYTESEYPPTTALPTQGDVRQPPAYAQSEWDSQYGGLSDSPVNMQTPGGGEKEEVGKWEENHTAWSKSSYAPRGTTLETVYEEQGAAQHQAYEGYYDDIDLGTADPVKAKQGRASARGSVVDVTERTNPFDDRHSSVYQHAPPTGSLPRYGHQRGPSSGSAGSGAGAAAALLTPHAHQKLGRMSVAPARYSLPPGHTRRPSNTSDEGLTPRSGGSNPYAPPGGLRFQQNLPRPSEKSGLRGLSLKPLRPDDMFSRMKITRAGQLYMTYRPFITPVLLLMSAMILTLAMQSGGVFGTFVKVQQGGFGGKVGEGTGGMIGLGASGWCQLETDNPVCKRYRRGDFVSSAKSFQIPGPDSLQRMLSHLLAALTALTWLLAVLHLTIAFLHFFLLFGLSIPWDFFITSDPLPPLTGVPPGMKKNSAVPVNLNEYEVVQKEVDMRVRCERPPYDAYGWVWWAWWAHRRGPLGHGFAAVMGVIGICALGIAATFYVQVTGAAKDSKASIGVGTLVPVISILFSLDPILSAVRYLVHARYNFDAFNNPPSPTPAAVLLPPNTRPMKHIRNTGADSYFATQEDPMQVDTIFAADPLAPPVPALPTAYTPAPPIDPETTRWLAAYPLDSELVSLIADLRAGMESDDFVLSDVGLLYLRPDPEAGEEGGDALLVPPAGQIRTELLQDAHFEVLEGGDEGGSAHWGPETMLAKIGETFWWPGIEEDCQQLVQGCQRCMRDGLDVEVEEAREGEVKPGMTPLLKTEGGMTGMMTVGESAIAADMAFAMRKAQDEARRGQLSA